MEPNLTERVSFRLSDREYDQLLYLAHAHNLTASKVMRAAAQNWIVEHRAGLDPRRQADLELHLANAQADRDRRRYEDANLYLTNIQERLQRAMINNNVEARRELIEQGTRILATLTDLPDVQMRLDSLLKTYAT